MSVVAIVLLGFGLADVASASIPPRVRPMSIALAVTLVLVGCAYVLGLTTWRPWALGIAMLMFLSTWLIAQREPPEIAGRLIKDPRVQLVVVAKAVILALALSSLFPAVGGPFATWFANLPVGGIHRANANQVALAIASAVFLLHTTNRIIRLVLAVVGAEVEAGQRKLKGGRYIGPIERLIVGALMLAGSLEGAGLIVAAKGFIRLPEIRSETDKKDGAGDSVAEYFLIGTLTSIAVAAALAALILAAAY